MKLLNIKKIKLLVLLLFIISSAYPQKTQITWDNTSSHEWDNRFEHVRIVSSCDKSMQDAWFYRTKQRKAQPLIISLHTWSGDYSQTDPLAYEVLLHDWNYIHPDFRGSNDKPSACGSKMTISDIEDAIHYAIKNANVDTTNVHIIGVSGGGYATLLSYMQIHYPVKSFNAWVPISNLSDWYWECTSRKLKYTKDIEQATSSNGQFNSAESDKRSPILMSVPQVRKNSSLHIYAGIHDGYSGSVPITQSINFYNKIARWWNPSDYEDIVDDSTIIGLLEKDIKPETSRYGSIDNRNIYLNKSTSHCSITIFEGGHEMLVNSALSLILK